MGENEDKGKVRWDGMVWKKGKFFSFRVGMEGENWGGFLEIWNVVGEKWKVRMRDSEVVKILGEYDEGGVWKMRGGGGSMEGLVLGEWKWY